MIAKYSGKTYTIQTLRAKAKFGIESFTLLDTAKATEDIGFKTLVVKVDFE